MARLIVGDDDAAFYASPRGGALARKPYVLWDQRSGGARYTDVLYVDGSAAGSGTVNGQAHASGVLLTAAGDGAYGAQLPDGLEVPGAWAEFDGRAARVWLPARGVDGELAGLVPALARVEALEQALPDKADAAEVATALGTKLNAASLTPALEAKQAEIEAAASATFVRRWKPGGSYVEGEPVVSPDGHVVQSLTDFIDGPTFNPLNFTQPPVAGSPQISIDAMTTPLAESGWGTIEPAATQYYGGYNKSTGGLGSWCAYGAAGFAVGQYRVEYVHRTGTDRGIVQIALNDELLTALGAATSTVNGYAVTAAPARTTLGIITITEPGVKLAKLTVIGAGTPGSGFVGIFSRLIFTRVDHPFF